MKAEQSIPDLEVPPKRYLVPIHSSIRLTRLIFFTISTSVSSINAYLNCNFWAVSISGLEDVSAIFLLLKTVSLFLEEYEVETSELVELIGATSTVISSRNFTSPLELFKLTCFACGIAGW